jgi:hypothetical protein
MATLKSTIVAIGERWLLLTELQNADVGTPQVRLETQLFLGKPCFVP